MIMKIVFCLYCLFAVAYSFFNGYRGIRIQKFYKSGKDDNVYNAGKGYKKDKWIKRDINIHCIHDFFFNFICTISGYAAFYFVVKIIKNIGIQNLTNISPGLGIFLSFLLLFSIIGMSGILPHVLYFGRFPSK